MRLTDDTQLEKEIYEHSFEELNHFWSVIK